VSGKRLLTHCLLALFTAAGCLAVFVLKPDFPAVESLTLGTGYAALLLLVVSLIIGPANLFLQRRNPVNLYLRRDIGIWAGLTGVAHVLLGFQVHMGGQILLYFTEQTHHGYRPLLNLFGLSNDAGALATLILLRFTPIILRNSPGDASLPRRAGRDGAQRDRRS